MLLAVAGGEAHQVIHDDVDRAAHGVAREVGVIHRLSRDALSGKRRVAVHQQRKIFRLAALAGAVLLGARASHRDRIDRLEVAGIGDQVDIDLAPLRVMYSPVAPR